MMVLGQCLGGVGSSFPRVVKYAVRPAKNTISAIQTSCRSGTAFRAYDQPVCICCVIACFLARYICWLHAGCYQE